MEDDAACIIDALSGRRFLKPVLRTRILFEKDSQLYDSVRGYVIRMCSSTTTAGDGDRPPPNASSCVQRVGPRIPLTGHYNVTKSYIFAVVCSARAVQ